MNIAGGNHRFMELLADLDNGAVHIPQLLHRIDRAIAVEEHIVPDGLDLQVVIVLGDLTQLVEALAVHNPTEQLARFTG